MASSLVIGIWQVVTSKWTYPLELLADVGWTLSLFETVADLLSDTHCPLLWLLFELLLENSLCFLFVV